MLKEEWKVVDGFKDVIDNKYLVSNLGKVSTVDGKILHQKIANKKKHPYYAVSLKTINGLKWILVHQLVATFFVPIDEKYKGLEVELVPDHLDNNGLNNVFTNLEWKTRGENVSDAFKMGYINKSGECNWGSLISNREAVEICEMFLKGVPYSQILSEMDFPDNKKYRTLLVRIKNRIAWTDISYSYVFDDTPYKYTESQQDVISKLKDIRRMISEGYSNGEIVNAMWKECKSRKSKLETVRLIRANKIYQNI